jgi:ATP-dependent DNA ligase
MRLIVRAFVPRFSGDYARVVIVAKGKLGFVKPMLAVAVNRLPEGQAWSYELKFDGYRAIGLKADGQVRLFSRNGKDFTARFASIARALKALPNDTVIDGEIVAYDTDGHLSFNVLQNHRGVGTELQLYAFDLMTLRGRDLTREPLEKRREILRARVMPRLSDSIRYSETMEASPAEFRGARANISKRCDACGATSAVTAASSSISTAR